MTVPSPLGSVGEVSETVDPTIENVTDTLDQVDNALRRLRDGKYRQCSTCGSTLSLESLEENPLRSNCEEHTP
jgi:RNA polymerase-binding transcription factor DksA